VTGASPKYECCKFRGAVTALDAATGKQIWKSYTIAEAPHPVRKNKQGTQLWGPSGAAVWSSPTIDPKRHAVYVTTGDALLGSARAHQRLVSGLRYGHREAALVAPVDRGRCLRGRLS
jgi:glucose dehydrogenase